MNVFFEILQVALGNRSKLSRILTTEEWNMLLKEAERQAVVGILFDGIERLPEDQRPSHMVLFQWIGETLQIEEQNKQLNKAAGHLSIICKNNRMNSCVLKGQGLARLYSNPLRRQAGDIDLWVCPENSIYAKNNLSQIRCEVLKWLKDSSFKTGSVVIHHVDAEIIKNIETEIHFMPIWLYNPWHNQKLQKFFNENSNKQFQNYNKSLGFCYPTPVFDIVYNLVHIFHHLLEEGIGIRHVVDYFYLLKEYAKSYNDNKSQVMKTIESLDLGRFFSALMYVLKEICRAPEEILLSKPDELEGKWLMNEIMAAGNFGHHRTDKNMHRNSLRRYAVMVKHYPSEALMMVPWKGWHWCWRKVNGY